MAAQTPVIGHRCVELRHFEVVRTVEEVGVECEPCPVELIAAAGYEFRSQ